MMQSLSASAASLGIALSNAILQRYQPDIDVMTGKGWDHSNSAVLSGIARLHACSRDPAHLAYISAFVDRYVAADGRVTSLSDTLDEMHPGVLCLYMYEQTGQEKYRLAATNMRNHFIGTPEKTSPFNRTPDGGYWHKNVDKYRNVMSVDGIYMVYPFLTQYAAMFGDAQSADIATHQILLVSERSFDKASQLPYHAWNYDRSHGWSNPVTGTSSQFWSRATGWYAMGLVDVLEHLPAAHPRHATLLNQFRSLAEGIIRHQHTDGMWHHVLNRAGDAGNYPESSATGMIVYALHKGVRLRLLPDVCLRNAESGWQALCAHIQPYIDGGPQVGSVAPAMGVQMDYASYTAIRPVTVPAEAGPQHPHGYIGALMAASEMAYG